MPSLETQVFEHTVTILVNSRILAAIRPKPEIAKDKMFNSSIFLDGDTVEVVDSSEEYVLARMLGMPIETEFEGDDEYSANLLAPQQVTINDAIEIFDLTEELRFKFSADILTFYNVTTMYLSECQQRLRYDPNSSGIPKEDVAKMEAIGMYFKEPASFIRDNGETGTDALSQLFALAFKTHKTGKRADNIGDDTFYVTKRLCSPVSINDIEEDDRNDRLYDI